MIAPTTQATAFSFVDLLPQHWPAQIDMLHWCQSLTPLTGVLLMAGGILYLVFGWSIYRVLISANAAVIGGFLGAMVGEPLGSMTAGIVLGAFILGIVAWPVMKYSVAVTGGLFGAAVGAALWRTIGLQPAYSIAGAAIGLIFLAMLSFIIFRTSVILFTSFQGSIMFVAGLLALTYKYPEVAPRLTRLMVDQPYVLPMGIFIATVVGHVYQHMRHHEHKEAAA